MFLIGFPSQSDVTTVAGAKCMGYRSISKTDENMDGMEGVVSAKTKKLLLLKSLTCHNFCLDRFRES